MDISIVIPAFNEKNNLNKLTNKLIGTLENASNSFEIIVVDNASVDGSVEMVHRDFPQVQLIANAENEGFVRANNQALPLSRGRYVLLLNSDAALLPGTLWHVVSVVTRVFGRNVSPPSSDALK